MKQNKKQRYQRMKLKKKKKDTTNIKPGATREIDEPKIVEDPFENQDNLGPIKHPKAATGVRGGF
jgi:hypothetical protein